MSGKKNPFEFLPKAGRQDERTAKPKASSADEQLLGAIAELKDMFERKIAVDEHKNRLFDNLHNELVNHRNLAYEKGTVSLALEIISVIESIKKTSAVLEEKYTQANYKKLLAAYAGLAAELDDVLYHSNIEPFHSLEDTVDVTKQKVIKVIHTNDKALDKKIAERLSAGYEKNGQVIKPERVTVYVYKPQNQE